MSTAEVINLVTGRADQVVGLSWTILLASGTTDAVLEKIRNAWVVVAGLGRAEDTELGEWPLFDEFRDRLPGWLSSDAFKDHGYCVETWWSDLEEREWIWWSSARQKDGTVRIVLKAFAMPISDWTLRAVIELAGATIIARDINIADEADTKRGTDAEREADDST